MNQAPHRALAPALAIGGMAMLFGGVGWALNYIMRSMPPIVEALTWMLALAGLGMQLAAIVLSVVGARRRGDWPVVASLYGLAVLAAVGAWAYQRFEAQKWYRDNPEAFAVEWNDAGTEVGVRTGDGVWWVPDDACPNEIDEMVFEMGTQTFDEYAEVYSNSRDPHMRLHIEERRVECLKTPLPLSHADLTRALTAVLNVDTLRTYFPEDSVLTFMGPRVPPLDSVRVHGRPVRVTDQSDMHVMEIRLLDPQPDRVRVDLGIYTWALEAQIEAARASDGSWAATVESLVEL